MVVCKAIKNINGRQIGVLDGRGEATAFRAVCRATRSKSMLIALGGSGFCCAMYLVLEVAAYIPAQ